MPILIYPSFSRGQKGFKYLIPLWSRSASFSAPSFDLVSLLVYHLRPVSFPPSLKKEKGNQSYKRTDKAILNIKKRKKIKKKKCEGEASTFPEGKEEKETQIKTSPCVCFVVACTSCRQLSSAYSVSRPPNAPYRSSFSSLSFRTPSLCESSLQ